MLAKGSDEPTSCGGLCHHRRLAERDLGDGTIMSRVDTLEHAVAALTRVQVCPRCIQHLSLSLLFPSLGCMVPQTPDSDVSITSVLRLSACKWHQNRVGFLQQPDSSICAARSAVGI